MLLPTSPGRKPKWAPSRRARQGVGKGVEADGRPPLGKSRSRRLRRSQSRPSLNQRLPKFLQTLLFRWEKVHLAKPGSLRLAAAGHASRRRLLSQAREGLRFPVFQAHEKSPEAGLFSWRNFRGQERVRQRPASEFRGRDERCGCARRRRSVPAGTSPVQLRYTRRRWR